MEKGNAMMLSSLSPETGTISLNVDDDSACHLITKAVNKTTA